LTVSIRVCISRNRGPILRITKKIEKAKNFNQGFKTVEYLYSAIYDLRIHMTAAEFLAKARKLANARARELGWII